MVLIIFQACMALQFMVDVAEISLDDENLNNFTILESPPNTLWDIRYSFKCDRSTEVATVEFQTKYLLKLIDFSHTSIIGPAMRSSSKFAVRTSSRRNRKETSAAVKAELKYISAVTMYSPQRLVTPLQAYLKLAVRKGEFLSSLGFEFVRGFHRIVNQYFSLEPITIVIDPSCPDVIESGFAGFHYLKPTCTVSLIYKNHWLLPEGLQTLLNTEPLTPEQFFARAEPKRGRKQITAYVEKASQQLSRSTSISRAPPKTYESAKARSGACYHRKRYLNELKKRASATDSSSIIVSNSFLIPSDTGHVFLSFTPNVYTKPRAEFGVYALHAIAPNTTITTRCKVKNTKFPPTPFYGLGEHVRRSPYFSNCKIEGNDIVSTTIIPQWQEILLPVE